MSLIRAKEYLKKYGLENKILEFDISSATVKEAAVALDCQECEIAKTLSFMIDEQPILIVTSGDKKIDNAKYKNEFHTKAKMIPFEEVESMIGHEVGGVCPFGINENVKVYLDISLQKFDYIYPACGSHNSDIKLSVQELANISKYQTWIDVCKDSL